MSAAICEPCANGNHASHSFLSYAGICVGCPCEYRPIVPPYDLSLIGNPTDFGNRVNRNTYASEDGWVTDKSFAVKRDRVSDLGCYNSSLMTPPIGPFLGDRSKAFHATGVILVGETRDNYMFVADDGDLRLIDRAYADVFFDVDVLYGDDDLKTPLQDRPTAADARLLILPIDLGGSQDKRDVGNIRDCIARFGRARQGLATIERILAPLAVVAALAAEVQA